MVVRVQTDLVVFPLVVAVAVVQPTQVQMLVAVVAEMAEMVLTSLVIC
jgi:hypothetical protein